MGKREHFVAKEILPEEGLDFHQVVKDSLNRKVICAIYERTEFNHTYVFSMGYSEERIRTGYMRGGIEMTVRGYIEDVSADPLKDGNV